MTRVALINPDWRYEGSIYFGCRSPHLPLELGISQQMLERAGHATLLLDAHMFGLSISDITAELRSFKPDIVVNGGPQAATFVDQAPLRWPDEMIRRHAYHHHRFDATPIGAGAEIEASRGCPYSCTFCAKDNFRNGYRKRPAAAVLQELDRL